MQSKTLKILTLAEFICVSVGSIFAFLLGMFLFAKGLFHYGFYCYFLGLGGYAISRLIILEESLKKLLRGRK